MNNKDLLFKASIGASKAILMTLFVGAAVVAPGGAASTLKVLGDLFENREIPEYKDRQINEALRYLKSRKLIHIQRQYQKEVFTLTKIGWFRARKLAKSFGIQKPTKWDGKWRIVIFDIPEEKKKKREVFRHILKNLGLANVQKSIWVHPYHCHDQIFSIAGEMFIKPYVRYIVAEEITGEKGLRRRFEI